jgi:hypothetical protein
VKAGEGRTRHDADEQSSNAERRRERKEEEEQHHSIKIKGMMLSPTESNTVSSHLLYTSPKLT